MTYKSKIYIMSFIIISFLVLLFLLLSSKQNIRSGLPKTDLVVAPTVTLGIPDEYRPQFIGVGNLTYKRQSNMPFRCDPSVEIIDQIMNAFPKSSLTFVNNALNMDVRLKIASGEPFISLPVEESFRIEIAETISQNRALYAKLTALMSNLGNNIGFIPDPVNAPNENDVYHEFQYVIKAHNLFYVIKPGNNDLEVNCVAISPEEAMAIDVIHDISRVKKYNSDTTLSLWEYVDNLAMIDVSSGAGGVGHYWGKINGSWKLLFTTQASPICEDIEIYRIGKGMSCARRSENNASSNVRY